MLLVAALVHDHCKPDTREEQPDGKITFYGHAERAAELCSKFAESVGLSPEESERLTYVVAQHMHAHNIPTFGANKRLEYYLSPHFPVLAALQEADARASWRSNDGSVHAEVHRSFFERDRQQLCSDAERKAAMAAVKGRVNRALKTMNIQPGPYLGKVGAATVATMDSAARQTKIFFYQSCAHTLAKTTSP